MGETLILVGSGLAAEVAVAIDQRESVRGLRMTGGAERSFAGFDHSAA